MQTTRPSKVWAVIYNPDAFPDELYQRALLALDSESAVKVRKFYRRADACRCLIGRFLRYMVLHDQNIDPQTAIFAVTETGKPYLAHPVPNPPIAFNVAHDNALVAVAFSSNSHNPPAYSVGIDLMKVSLPGRASFSTFMASMNEALTPLEYHQVTTGKSDDENLQRFFWSWTMKEAYTKALGLGLTFNIRRIEFDAAENLLRVDGERLAGWQFTKFKICIEGDDYQGVVAEYIGGDGLDIIHESTQLPGYLNQCDAVSFVNQTFEVLSHNRRLE